MKNKFLVINKDGEVFDPKKYLGSPHCSDEFKVFIRREVFGEIGEVSKEKPQYLSYAQNFGFNWEPNSDNGFLNYDYKAQFIMRLIQDYARQLVENIGFPIYEVRGSNIFDMSYPVVEAYAKLYGDRLFQFKSGGKNVVMSYDASYPQFNLAAVRKPSFKYLPYAHFSIADCYRHEQSGECMVLHRLRRFFMPDLHPYFKDVREAFLWYPKIEKQIVQAGSEVRCNYHIIAEIASQKVWERYQSSIIEIAKRNKMDVIICIDQDDAERYWIVNVDYKIIDKLAQSREIACIQIDMGNAKRLGIEYIDQNGKLKNPVIIHSAIPGGIERFIYMLLDNFEKRFPLWLFPIQIRLLPLSEKYRDLAHSIINRYKNFPVRIDIDDSDEVVGKRLKRAKLELIPYVFVLGEKEKNGKGNSSLLDKAVKDIQKNAEGKPFLKFNWPIEVGRRIK